MGLLTKGGSKNNFVGVTTKKGFGKIMLHAYRVCLDGFRLHVEIPYLDG